MLTLMELGRAALDRRQLARAQDLFLQSTTLGRAAGCVIETPIAIQHAGLCALEQQQFDAARRLLDEAVVQHRRTGNQHDAANTLVLLARLALNERRLDEARALSAESQRVFRALHDPKCGAKTCTDFPAEPIVGAGVPTNAATLFGDPSKFTPGSLCALEPQLSSDGKEGAMMPANWVRPRFRVAAPAGIDLLEIRISSPVEKNDLVAYTTYSQAAGGPAPSWYLPKEYWSGDGAADAPAAGNGFANNAAGQPVTVTIRGVNSKAPAMPVGVTGTFNIAPVVATGAMVFWTERGRVFHNTTPSTGHSATSTFH